MQAVTVSQITERLQALPSEKLAVVYDFVSYLTERELTRIHGGPEEKAVELMYASESVLGRDWNRPEEDAAWATL